MVASDERECGATVRCDDQTNPGSKPIKTTTDLFGNILCSELNQLSSQYLKTSIHQSLSLTFGCPPDLHCPSASDFVFFLRPRTQPRSGGFGCLVSGLHRRNERDRGKTMRCDENWDENHWIVFCFEIIGSSSVRLLVVVL